jgi:hypothetical protein
MKDAETGRFSDGRSPVQARLRAPRATIGPRYQDFVDPTAGPAGRSRS